LLTLRIPTRSLRSDATGTTEVLLEIVERIRTIPGVVAAGATDVLPFGEQNGALFQITVESGVPPPPDPRDGPAVVPITFGYFRALGVPIVAGRDFEPRDRESATPVAIVNHAFVESTLGDRDPIGRRLTLNGEEIVGLVADLRRGTIGRRIDEDQQPTVYVPFPQSVRYMGGAETSLVVRTDGDPMALIEHVRRVALVTAPTVVLFDVQTMEGRVSAFVLPERQRAVLFGVFAVASVLLAAVGLYSLMAYLVASEMREFGVRLTLGAGPTRLFGLVVRRGLGPVCAGVVVGIGGAAALVRTLESFLFGVTPTDPATYAAAAIVMIGVGLLACALPARRAMAADPLVVLRSE
jgi:predicted permease